MSLLDLDKFNLATVYAEDLKVAQKFYTDILGFEKKADMDAGIIMRHEAAKVTLFLEGGRTKRESPEMKYPMISICFNSRTGVKTAMEALKKADIPVIGTFGDMNSDFAGFHFKDPSGNVLEIGGKP